MLLTHMLLPLSESGFFQLDLLCESLSQHFLFFSVLWVVQLSDLGLSEFTSLHLRQSIRFIVVLLGAGDEVKHEGSDQKSSKSLKVAMLFVLDWASASIMPVHSPSATPHRYSRPLTTRPSAVVTSSTLPMTEKGMTAVMERAFSAAVSSSASTGGV